jgi:hypothetical protein
MKNRLIDIELGLIVIMTILLGCTAVEVFKVCSTTQEAVHRIVQ